MSTEPIDWDRIVKGTPVPELRAGTGYLMIGPAPEGPHDGNGPRSTKVIHGTFRVIYHGDYVPADEVAQNLMGVLDGALDDRDDLRTWDFKVELVAEMFGDPEGYDR